MHIRELALALGLVAGCVVKEDLGQTAGDDGDGSGEGGSGGPGAGTDDASASLSGTTATPGDGASDSSGGSDEGDVAETGTTGEDVPLGRCDPHPETLVYDPGSADEWPIPGLEAYETAVLEGACALAYADRPEERSDAEDVERFALALDCVLDGSIDGEPVRSHAAELEYPMAAAGIDPASLPVTTPQEVRLRLVHALIGFSYSAWVVLERDDGTLLFDSVWGIRTDPTDRDIPIGAQVSDLLAGAPWHGGFEMSTVATDCDHGGSTCGAIEHAMELGFEGGRPLRLETWQTGTIPTARDQPTYRATMAAARTNPQPTCTDVSDAYYRFTIWAETP